MAITFTPIADQNNTSILRPLDSEIIFSGTSTLSLAGKTLYIQLGMFLDIDEPLPIYFDPPTTGYRVTFPSDTIPVIVPQISTQYSQLTEPVTKLTFTRASTTTFTILMDAIMTMDLHSLSPNFGVDNVQRITKNSRYNAKRLDNKYSCVYNKQKVLRLLVYVFDGQTPVDYGYVDIKYNSRFFATGLNFGASEFTNFQYYFFLAAGMQPGFSINQNTSMRFVIDGTWTGGGYLAIWEDTGQDNNTQFYNDLNFNLIYFNGSGGKSTVFDYDDSAIVSVGSITTIGSTSKYINVVFSLDYFDVIKKYRVAFIPIKASDYSNTFITDLLSVTDFQPPTVGDIITDQIWNYNSIGNIYKRCVGNVAPKERLIFKLTQGKESYNANLITDGNPGSWDDNFVGYSVYLYDTYIPDGHAINLNLAEELTNKILTDTDTENGGEVEIRIRPEWAGTSKYVIHVWRFKLQVNDSTTEDQEIYGIQSMAIADYVDDTSILYVGMTDSNSNTITKICGDTGIVNMKFRNLLENNSFDLIAYLEGSEGEEDVYQDGSDKFEKQNTVAITEMDQNFVAVTVDDITTNDANVKIDTSKLDYGKQYCLNLIGISQDTILGECVASANIDIILTLVQIVNQGYTVNIDYSGLTVGVKEVEIVVNRVTDKPLLGEKPLYYKFTSSSGSTGEFSKFGAGWALLILEISVTIKTDNNCYLSDTKQFSVQKVVKTTDSQTLTLV